MASTLCLVLYALASTLCLVLYALSSGISGLPKFHSGVNHYGQKPDMLRQACRTVNEGTALPPLRPKLQSNVAERKRKTEAIQKSRHSKPHH